MDRPRLPILGKNAEPKTPYQRWLPEWRCVIGPMVEKGKMQLPRNLFQMKKGLLVDEFSVFLAPQRVHLGLRLTTGEAFVEQRLVYSEKNQLPPRTPRELIWCWRRRAEMYSLDESTKASEIECFFLGFETRPIGGQKTRFGWKITEDGRFEESDLKKASV